MGSSHRSRSRSRGRSLAVQDRVYRFIHENGVDAEAERLLRSLAPDEQERVLEDGQCSGVNPSAVLISRIRRLVDKPAPVPTGPLPVGALESFIQENELDGSAVNALAQVPPEVQARVVGEGLVTGRNKSAILIGRIRRCLRGEEAQAPLGGAVGHGLPAEFDAEQHKAQMERFLREHGFDEYAEKVMLEQRTDVQIRVLSDGEVTGDNKSKILMGRIKRAQLARTGDRSAASAGAQAGSLRSVEEFVSANEIDGLASRELYSLPSDRQLAVINEGDITGGNKSAILMGRIRRVNQGEAPGLNSLRAPLQEPGGLLQQQIHQLYQQQEAPGGLQQQQQIHQQYQQQAQWQQYLLQWHQAYNLQQQQLAQCGHLLDPMKAAQMAMGGAPLPPPLDAPAASPPLEAALGGVPPFPPPTDLALAGAPFPPPTAESPPSTTLQVTLGGVPPFGPPSEAPPPTLGALLEPLELGPAQSFSSQPAVQAHAAYAQAYEQAFLRATGGAAEADAEIEGFVFDNSLDDSAAQVLRDQPTDVQEAVVAEGPLTGSNKSAVLMSRIRRIVGQSSGWAGRVAGSGEAPRGNHPHLDDFIRDNYLDAGAESVLRQQPPQIAQRVLDEGTIVGGLNRSAILISRIRRIQKDLV